MVEAQGPNEAEEAKLAEQSREVERKVEALVIPMTRTDDFRDPSASGWGGFELRDDELLGKHRSVITEMVSVSATNFPPFLSMNYDVSSLFKPATGSKNSKWRIQFDESELPNQVYDS